MLYQNPRSSTCRRVAYAHRSSAHEAKGPDLSAFGQILPTADRKAPRTTHDGLHATGAPNRALRQCPAASHASLTSQPASVFSPAQGDTARFFLWLARPPDRYFRSLLALVVELRACEEI